MQILTWKIWTKSSNRHFRLRITAPLPLASSQVDGKTVEEYVRRFQWNEARFSPRLNLREIVDKIVGEMTQLEDDLKARLLDYNSVKNAVAAEVRRHQGSLVVKDIHTLERYRLLDLVRYGKGPDFEIRELD